MSWYWRRVFGRSWRWEVNSVRGILLLVVRVRRRGGDRRGRGSEGGGCRFCHHSRRRGSRPHPDLAHTWITLVEVHQTERRDEEQVLHYDHLVTTRHWRYSDGGLLPHQTSVSELDVDIAVVDPPNPPAQGQGQSDEESAESSDDE